MRLAPPPLSLRQLQYALAVAEELSFRRAAERCHVSQPALSAQLAELEVALGVRLFERDRRRVLVTAAGHELVGRARRVLLETDDLVESAKRWVDPLSGSLRLGVIPTVSPYLLPSAARALKRELPKLGLHWVEDRTETLLRALDAGELDAALLALEAELGDVEVAVIGKDPFVLAAPHGHPLASKTTPVAAGELAGHAVLLLTDGHCLRQQALSFCERARAEELEFRATSLSTLVQMVAAGAGVTLLPELSLATEASRARLVIRRFKSPAPHRTLALVWRRRSPLGTALARVAGIVQSAFRPAVRAR